MQRVEPAKDSKGEYLSVHYSLIAQTHQAARRPQMPKDDQDHQLPLCSLRLICGNVPRRLL